MNPAISIIVAIYQAEAYLHRCIDSILSQTEKDFELLLIDDGSTDKSGLICDEYALIDNRIRVFHKNNEGVSATRQFGIDQSRGKYSIHCDPDDWIEPDMLMIMLEKAESDNADIVFCDMMLEYARMSKLCKQSPPSLDSKSLWNVIYYPLSAGLCNKLIRMDSYSKYNVHFANEITYGEDLFIMLQLLRHPLRIAYIPKAFYHYDRHSNSKSLCKNFDSRSLQKSIDVFLDRIGECPAVNKLKLDAIRMAHRQHINNERFVNLYPEVNKYILKIALRSPIREWRLVSVILYRLGFVRLSNKYTNLMECINQIFQ